MVKVGEDEKHFSVVSDLVCVIVHTTGLPGLGDEARLLLIG